jgi:5'-deoxynucleotidase YfbR-like HD superfamily hydrolase
MTKKESKAIGKLATQLALLLQNLSYKYYDENESGPTADIYAKDYAALQKLEGEMTWWML